MEAVGENCSSSQTPVAHLASSGSAGKTTAHREFAREQVDLRVVPERNRSSAREVSKVNTQVLEIDQLLGSLMLHASHSTEWNDNPTLLDACSAKFLNEPIPLKNYLK